MDAVYNFVYIVMLCQKTFFEFQYLDACNIQLP